MRRISIIEHRPELWLTGMMIGPRMVQQKLNEICPKWESANTPRDGDDWWIKTECESNCTICKAKQSKVREDEKGKRRDKIEKHKCQPPNVFYEDRWWCGRGRVYCVSCDFTFN